MYINDVGVGKTLTPIFLKQGVIQMRRMRKRRIDVIRNDLKRMIEEDGDTVTFTWTEITGGTWNPTYEIWEGGTEEEKTYSLKGIGKVVDYKEDQMETEYGRIDVGQCIVRFPYDSNHVNVIKNKSNVSFWFRSQKWKIDSNLEYGEFYDDQRYSFVLIGVKSTK